VSGGSCNLPAKGEQVELVSASGASTVGELLAGLARRAGGGPWKIEAALDLEGGGYTIILDGEGDRVVLACVEGPRGEAYTGDRALEALSRISGESPLRGYAELQRLTRAGLELDMAMAPEARPSGSPTIEEALSPPGASGGAGVMEAYRMLEPASREALESSSEETRAIIEKASRGEELSMEEVSAVLTDLIYYSTTLTVSGDYRRLVREAVERSRANGAGFYRVYIELSDGATMNLFIYRGRLCSVLLVDPGSNMARRYTGSLEELERLIEERGVSHARLDRVSCRDCARPFIKSCVEEPREAPGEAGKPAGEPGRRQERRGFLSRIFGRR